MPAARGRWGRAFICATAVLLIATAHEASPAPTRAAQSSVASLTEQLAALSPKVRRTEAGRAAVRAHEVSQELATVYGATGPAQFHNFLVNIGVKKRGLCHHWTHDLIERLHALKLTSLELHWATARRGTLREHNAVVLTAKREPFSSGIVLDPWRRSGRLFAGSVATDRYPWKEDLSECFCSRGHKRRQSQPRAERT